MAADRLDGCAVIYDLDGTFVDTAADLAAALNHVMEAEGRAQMPLADVRHMVGHGAAAMLRQGFGYAANKSEDDEKLGGYVERFLDYYMAHIAVHSRPFPGVLESITTLRGMGARFAICTNKREAPAKKLLTALGLDEVFGIIIGSDSVEAAKPDPAPVRACLEGLGATRAVFFGDSDTDIRAAASCDLPCLLHRGGYGPFTLADSAFAQFDDYTKTPPLVLSAMQSIGQSA